MDDERNANLLRQVLGQLEQHLSQTAVPAVDTSAAPALSASTNSVPVPKSTERLPDVWNQFRTVPAQARIDSSAVTFHQRCERPDRGKQGLKSSPAIRSRTNETLKKAKSMPSGIDVWRRFRPTSSKESGNDGKGMKRTTNQNGCLETHKRQKVEETEKRQQQYQADSEMTLAMEAFVEDLEREEQQQQQQQQQPEELRDHRHTEKTPRNFQSFAILEVEEGGWGEGKIIRGLRLEDRKVCHIHVKNGWDNAPLRSGHLFNLVFTHDCNHRHALAYTVDAERNYLVLEPNLLLTGTCIGRFLSLPLLSQQLQPIQMMRCHVTQVYTSHSSFMCSRQSVLDLRFKGAKGPTSPRLITGILTHSLLELALKANDFSSNFLLHNSVALIRESLLALLSCNLSETEALYHLRCQFPSMQHWAATFLSNPNLSCTASACPVPTPVTTETDTTTLFNRSQSLNSPLNPLPKNMPVSISSSLSRTKKDGAGNISASYALRGYGTNSQHQRAPTGGSVVVSNSRREGRTRIEKVVATEQTLCSRSFGLKGKVDATVFVEYEPPTEIGKETSPPRYFVAPLEWKTGKQRGDNGSATHRAQVALYSLLMAERYQTSVPLGFLYYTQGSRHDSVIGVGSHRGELSALLQARNAVAHFLSTPDYQLPPMLGRKSTCDRCHMQERCFLFHKALENGTAATSGAGESFDLVTAGVSPSDAAYLRKWERLIDLEAREMDPKSSTAYWNASSELEASGEGCIGSLSMMDSKDDGEQNQFVYTFARSSPLQHSCITEGDWVSISTECGIYCVSQGFVTRVETCFGVNTRSQQRHAGGYEGMAVCVSVRSREPIQLARVQLQNREEKENGEAVQSIADIEDCFLSDGGKNPFVGQLKRFSWRIDQQEMSSFIGQMRNHISNMILGVNSAAEPHAGTAVVSPHHPTDSVTPQESNNLSLPPPPLPRPYRRKRRLKDLIVDLAVPQFDDPGTLLPYSSQLEVFERNLNVDQRAALRRVLTAQDYCLLLGMPGTGKTLTLGHVICALLLLGRKVLLTSYTHAAVDNMLIKAKEVASALGRGPLPALRLGRESQKIIRQCYFNRSPAHTFFLFWQLPQVHADCLEFSINLQKYTTVAELRNAIEAFQLVATTCLGAGDPLLQLIDFDYCIVDEASQITEPLCLGPVQLARTFVLVGDHYQLPPLVRAAAAREGQSEGGLDQSLFERLCGAQPSAVCNLGIQYRMARDIMNVANLLIYGGRLRCGSKSVADARLIVSNQRCQGLSSWLSIVVSPEYTVLFLDTDPVKGAEESRSVTSNSRMNRRNTGVADSKPSQPDNNRRKKEEKGVLINQGEAAVTAAVCQALVRCGVHHTDVGVISPYRSQIAEVEKRLDRLELDGIEVHTVDRYQGRDKEAIIVTLVRNNTQRKVGRLLRDWRRVNVAFTRAKRKLVVVGSAKTLSTQPLFATFLRESEKNGWLVRLPTDVGLRW